MRSSVALVAKRVVRLVVGICDIIEGTITPKLLERAAPGLIGQRRDEIGTLPTVADMAEAITDATTDSTLPSGHTVIVGGSLDALG